MNSELQNSLSPQKLQKIFYVWNYLEWGGAQIYFFGLIKEAKKFAEARVILPRGSDKQLLGFLDALDVRYEFFDSFADSKPADSLKRKIERHWNKLRGELLIIKYLSKIDLKNSVVHIELAPWQSLVALGWLCRRTKVFVTIHNSFPPLSSWRYLLWQIKFRLLTRCKNFSIFTSNRDARENLREFVSGDFFEKIRVTYTNVNPPEIDAALAVRFNRAELLEKYELPDDKFLVFCVGQFIDRKGRWTFLKAAREISHKDSDVVFVWVSNSKPSAADLEKARSFGLGEKFRLITSEQVGAERIDLFLLMRLADIFTLPSVTEGLPIALLEAMALEKPCISTNVNAIPEAIKHLETGWLIEAGDSEALAVAIENLKNEPKLRERLAKAGRLWVLENFDERKVAQIAVESYRESFKD